MKKLAIKGASVLALAGFLSKILAALYRFPYQNLVGDQGFYAFQQVYPFYAIITTLSLIALPNFLSSLIHSANHPKEETHQFFQLSLILSVLSFVVLTLLSQPISKLMGQEKLAGPFVMAILPLLLVPFLSLYRGRAQAKQDMVTTAVSQVIEQSVRVVLIICAALMFTRLSTNVYAISFLAMLGSFIGGLVALVYLMLSSPFKFQGLFTNLTALQPKCKIIQKFGLSSLVFTFFMIYMLILQMTDVFFVKNALMHLPQVKTSNQAEILKGIYDRGQPFLQLGLVFTTSILTDSLPKLTRDKQISKKIWDNVTYLAIALTVGLVILLPEMNDVLFKSHAHVLSLQILVCQIPIISMIQLYHHDLFLVGKNKMSGLILLSGLVLKLVSVYPLTVLYGLNGSALSSLISLLLVLIFYSLYSRKLPRQLFNFQFWFAILMMGAVVMLGNHTLTISERWLALFKLTILSGLGAATFFKVFNVNPKDFLN